MNIMDFLCQDAITVDLKAQTKKEAIIELIELLKSSKKIKRTDEIIEIVLEREKLGSTGIGQEFCHSSRQDGCFKRTSRSSRYI
jgi:PTS system nitrogen regulatory IIA component